MAPLLLLMCIIGFVKANPFPNTLDNRLVSQVQNELLLVAKNRSDIIPDEKLNNMNNVIENTNLSLKHTSDRLKISDAVTRDESAKRMTQRRQHKAIFVDYSLEPPISHYPKMDKPAYEVNYNDNAGITTKDKLRESKKYQESDIFYIRLPPTPYMFVPGLGYISQPPTYSTSALKPQLALIPQLLQLPHVRPAQPVQPVQFQLPSPQSTNPLIKLPIDFVSNGKPTSVYQWQKKSNKKPVDSPIMNLDNLSTDFISNGKPTSVHQWQTKLNPVKRPDDSLNSLDLGPYTFNGKLTSVYLLGSDDSSSMHQSIRYSDYQDDFQNMYY
ncbi:hypothetical protein HN011_009273 [Eciton burchellii]|jgi:hypothetical protein|nr:hypothetical protein HN011_009273 [Eciton burchellii]